jgi:hypothetical protein
MRPGRYELAATSAGGVGVGYADLPPGGSVDVAIVVDGANSNEIVTQMLLTNEGPANP